MKKLLEVSFNISELVFLEVIEPMADKIRASFRMDIHQIKKAIIVLSDAKDKLEREG